MVNKITNIEGAGSSQYSNNAMLAEVPSYSVGDNIISSSKYSKGKCGVVRRVSYYGVHVQYEDGFFEVFHFKPTHHMQTGLQCLAKVF